MPQVGEIRKGRDIGYKNTRGNFVWQACVDCGKERWVKLVKGSPETQRCLRCGSKLMGKEHRGQLGTSWKGGRVITREGYVLVLLQPDDFFYPMASKDGYVLEHRLVMAKHLGRSLQSWETVHHKNGIKDDNRLKNLELSSTGSHSLSHSKGYRAGYIKGYEDGKNAGKIEVEVDRSRPGTAYYY